MTRQRVTRGAQLDRRTLLQTSGAAGAGALGLGTVTADEDADHYVVASDAHLGSPFANDDAFEAFLGVGVPLLDPDVLVLAGDIYELWFRGMSSALLEFSNVSEYLEALEDAGIDVVLVAGNHDRRLVTIGEELPEEVAPGSPWEVGEEFYFESGGEEFVAVHGDGVDPVHQDPVSDALCAGTDELGALLLALIGFWDGLKPWAAVGEIGSVTAASGAETVSLDGSYADPVVLTTPLGEDDPEQVRVEAVAADGFEVTPVDPDAGVRRVQYAVFERGRHVLGGNTAVEAGRAPADGEWTTVTFSEAFAEPPVVLADVRAERRDPSSRRRDRGSDRHNARPGAGVETPPQVRNVTELGFELRVPGGGSGAVDFAAVEPGDLTVRGRRGVAAVDDIDGTERVAFGRQFGDAPAVFATSQSSGDDPTLAAVPERDSAAATLSVRSAAGTATDGPVGYLVFAGGGQLRASESTSADVLDAESLLASEWERLLDRADGPFGTAVPDQPPAVAGVEPAFLGHEMIKAQLLDTYEEFVLFGHTHVPDLGDRYANPGPWTARGPDEAPENSYVEIVDGEATVWAWTSEGEREPLFEP